MQMKLLSQEYDSKPRPNFLNDMLTCLASFSANSSNETCTRLYNTKFSVKIELKCTVRVLRV